MQHRHDVNDSGRAGGRRDTAQRHDDAHPHHHHHSHGIGVSSHIHETSRRRLAIVLALTSTFMVVEFVGGWLANSLALMADAGHMLGDVAALSLSLFALWFSRRPATPEKTYGYHRFEILAALANGVALAAIALVIYVQAFGRLRNPEPVEGGLMLAVASAGLAVNIFAAFLLHAPSGHNLNVRGAYMHVLGDLLGSVGAITAAVIVLTTGWTPADPLISILVASLILFGSWRLIRESVDILLEAVPRDIDLGEVRGAILAVPGVEEVHDLHVWTLTSGFRAMSGHAVLTDPRDHSAVLEAIHHSMHDHFGIEHVTVQVEYRRMVRIGERLDAR